MRVHAMALSDAAKTRLLGAIETNSLVILCGAGLSMAEPSNLLATVEIARRCYDTWVAVEPALDPALRIDIDQLAGHFHSRGDFARVFIPLIPWNELVGTPNAGHAAIADFLISRAARAALSSNFDVLIESWAEEHKVAMLGALTGQEAANATNSGPLLKFHGCLHLDRKRTLWTHAQLDEQTVMQRVQSCAEWMNLILPGKHLVVVGFWTDWGYLNDVLEQAFGIETASSITVIDPATSATLQAKAPGLWQKLTSLSDNFEHIQVSGADALDDLRTEYSRVWVRRLFTLGEPLAAKAGIPASSVSDLTRPDELNGNQLYNLRRDGEGVPYVRAAKTRSPPESAAEVAFVQIYLLKAGAQRDAGWLRFDGRSIRVVNGAGQDLRTVQSAYKEPSTLAQADLVICAGAVDLGVPARIIAEGRGTSIVRPTPGGSALWMTREDAIAELKL